MDMDFRVPVNNRPNQQSATEPTPEPVPAQPQVTGSPTGPAPVAPMPPQKKGGKARKILVIFLVLILLLGGAAAAWWWKKDQDKKKAAQQDASSQAAQESTNNEEQEEASAISCEDVTTEEVYKNEELGFGFCYPKAWGEPVATEDKLAPEDTGKRFVVKFPSNTNVRVAVVSKDWTTQVARGGECYFPGNEAPDFAGFSTEWVVEESSVSRGIEKLDDKYLISEDATEFFGGVCARGVVIVNTADFPQVTVSYFKSFDDTIATPSAHKTSPTTLFSTDDRAAFVKVVKSVKKL